MAKRWIAAAISELRDRHLVRDNTSDQDVATVLLEGYARNCFQTSEAALPSLLFATSAPGVAAGPDGATSAISLVEDTTNVYHVQYWNPCTFATQGYSYTLAFGAKADTRTKLFVNTGTTNNNGSPTIFDLSNGTITTAGSGRTYTIQSLDDGWYWITVSWSVVGTAGTDGRAAIGLVGPANATAYQGDGTSRVLLWRVNCFANRPYATSPIKTAAGGVGGWPQTNTAWAGPSESSAGTGRPPDEPLELDATAIGATPQAMTILLEFYERGTAFQDSEGGTAGVLWSICKYDGTGARLYVKRGTTGYQFGHHNGTSAVTSEVAAFPAFNQKVRLRLIFNADGSVQLGQSLDEGSESVASASSANTPAATWATDSDASGRVCMWVNGLGKTNPASAIALRRITAAAGLKTLTELLAL